MDNNTSEVLKLLILFGWTPILALGRAVSSIIRVVKQNDEIFR